ncbi:hypothetical protein B0H94_102233 [Salsuginibacillus halophilus]|uniref:TRAP transporter TAXI family solute receptor n=1 Tax=Salsuginibacillus halophilus TaxID=517424 RepID=A0A2P8HXJ8_9BACI|nr:TAXI family TRAP transporter solute-binding subunit [Salsuginibacillus halophilus]PSL50956.1 hypothetical protein B0H94_102233 [Salsuginibacillus halophilus]
MKSRLLMMLAMGFTVGTVLVACGEEPDGDEAPEEDEGAEEDGAEEDGEAAGDVEEVTDMQLGTGSTGGTYYPLGNEMATVMNDNVDYDDFSVSAVSTGASVENLASIGQGDLQLGMSVHLPALDAYNGEADFDGNPVDNFGFMGHIYPEVMQIVALEDSGIESIEDLEGADVAIGPDGSGTQEAARIILEAYGLEEGDYNEYAEGFGDAANRMQNGNLDASFGLLGLPNTTIEEDLGSQRDITLLSVDEEELTDIEENSGYEGMTIEADDYSFLDEDVEAVTAYAILVGSTDQIGEDLGYEIVKGLYENTDEVSHQQGEAMDMENIMNGSNDLPLHPGAERFFEEEGLLDE